MLTRTPPASRSLLSQPWSPSSVVASFSTSASIRDSKPLRPIPKSTGWDGLSGTIPRRGLGPGKDVGTAERREIPRKPASLPARVKPLPRHNVIGRATRFPAPLEKRPIDPHPRSEIMKEMKAFIWEKIAAAPPGSDPPPIQYKIARDPTAPASPHAHGKQPKQPLKLPPMDSELQSWLRLARQDHEAHPTEIYNGPTLLVLKSASTSLLESDFYRLAQQGKHLENWAVGLVRVIQARDPTTYEPLGKYYIFFETRTAAMAYEEEVTRLYHLARRQLSSTSDSPNPLSAPEVDGEMSGFTLIPPSAILHLKLYLGKDIEVGRDEDRNQRLLFRPDGQDLFTVLVSLEGATTTVGALHDAIERDAEERKVPWREFGRGYRGIRAVEAGGEAVLEEGEAVVDDLQWDGEPARNQRFSRFVVPFTDENNVRRFVRHWHRREMPDFEGRDMTVTVNATAMW